jgi:hypothetical protein
LLGRGKKVTVVYGTMTEGTGPAAGVWVRLTTVAPSGTGTISAIAQTDISGGYLFFDGQACNDGLEACSTGTSLAFKNANNVATTVTVIGRGTLGDPAPAGWATAPAAMPAGKTNATVTWSPNGSSNLGTNPNYSLNVTYGTAYNRNWKFTP